MAVAVPISEEPLMTSSLIPRVALVVLAVGLAACDQPATAPRAPAAPSAALTFRGDAPASAPELFASGFVFPRGLTFSESGLLVVAEAGSGGTGFTTAEDCPQVIPPVGPYTNGNTARVSLVDWRGNRVTLADGFPSGHNGVDDFIGVADVAIIGNSLYAMSAGGGCSHGATVPAAVYRLGLFGQRTLVADLSNYLAHNPVAQPEEDDFEPDGTWYSMIRDGATLVAVEPNHGDIVRINPRSGAVQRIVDVSASQGHIVPTALATWRGALFFGNLGTFPSPVGSEKIFRVRRNGTLRVVAEGFTQVLGLEFDRFGRLYVLESSTSPLPSPGSGQVTRLDRFGHRTVIASGLFFPTGMTFGPNGDLYVSNKGFGPPQSGEVLRIRLRDDGDRRADGWEGEEDDR
jgi:hypothetical protein